MIERDRHRNATVRSAGPAARSAAPVATLCALALLLVPGAVAAQTDGAALREMEAIASSVEIVRDTYGVPHIYGPTDASVVFGEAWAEAEDNWWQVEDNFVRAIGRGAELHGRGAVADDYVARAMRIESLSRSEYETARPDMRRLYDAYAAGFNLWLARHPRAARLLERVEPWYAIALIRFKYHHNEYVGYAGLQRNDIARLVTAARIPNPRMEEDEINAATGSSPASAAAASIGVSRMQLAGVAWPGGERPLGSNEWAVSGARTAGGHPMLLARRVLRPGAVQRGPPRERGGARLLRRVPVRVHAPVHGKLAATRVGLHRQLRRHRRHLGRDDRVA
jgi:acyl-homoserine lactone acylase PvdQ